MGWSELQDRYWKTCLASELKAHMKIRKKELEELKKNTGAMPDWRTEAKLKKEKEKAEAFALLKEYEPKPSNSMCRRCGKEIARGANFCTNCGEPVPSSS